MGANSQVTAHQSAIESSARAENVGSNGYTVGDPHPNTLQRATPHSDAMASRLLNDISAYRDYHDVAPSDVARALHDARLDSSYG